MVGNPSIRLSLLKRNFERDIHFGIAASGLFERSANLIRRPNQANQQRRRSLIRNHVRRVAAFNQADVQRRGTRVGIGRQLERSILSSTGISL